MAADAPNEQSWPFKLGRMHLKGSREGAMGHSSNPHKGEANICFNLMTISSFLDSIHVLVHVF